MPMYQYDVMETCWRTDVGPVARKFIEGERIEIPFKITSPKFRLVETFVDPPVEAPKIDPQLEALNKKVAARKAAARQTE